ncbi:MAG: AI-2E family transporter [Bdellovibrio sp.]|nr:AI-2E family transporter [Bdellovibrio sp.]
MIAAEKYRIVKYVLVSAVLLLFAYTFTPFFTAILLAVLFAFALESRFKKFSKKNINRPWLTIAFLVGMFLLVTIPVGLVVVKTISTVKKYSDVGFQTTPLYMSTEKMVHRFTEQIYGVANKIDVDLTHLPQPSDIVSKGAVIVGAAATGLLGILPDIGLGIFVFALVLYFLLTESEKLKKGILKLDLVAPKELDQMIMTTQKSSYTALVASAMIGCVQAGTLSIIAYFFGFTEFMVLFVITFIFSLIPVIGAAPVAIFLALTAYIQDQNGVAICMLVTAVIVGSVDNIVKPLIANSNDEVHPIVSLLSLIGAIMVFGAPGILLGPVLTDLAYNIGPILFPSKDV